MASSILTVKSAQRSEFPIYSKTLDAYEAMPSLIYLIFCITIGVLAEFDPTITSLTDITHTVFTTLPLSPEDPNYFYQDRDESIDESNADETLEKRTPPIGIHVCEYPNWAGKCAWQPFKDGACLEYPWESGASIGVSGAYSFRLLVPDSISQEGFLANYFPIQPTTGIQCKFYYGPKCGPGDRTDGGLTYPGTPNLGRLYPNAKVPLGYRCRRCASNDLW